jgi:hypothetical protein
MQTVTSTGSEQAKVGATKRFGRSRIIHLGLQAVVAVLMVAGALLAGGVGSQTAQANHVRGVNYRCGTSGFTCYAVHYGVTGGGYWYVYDYTQRRWFYLYGDLSYQRGCYVQVPTGGGYQWYSCSVARRYPGWIGAGAMSVSADDEGPSVRTALPGKTKAGTMRAADHAHENGPCGEPEAVEAPKRKGKRGATLSTEALAGLCEVITADGGQETAGGERH